MITIMNLLNKENLWRFIMVSLCVLGIYQGAHADLLNGSFEEPRDSPGAGNVSLFDASQVPGWQTTSSDNIIEIWSDNVFGVPAYDGDQFAELNATEVATLFQDASGIAAGSVVGFEFAHRGRAGVDTMALTITDLGADNLPGGGDDAVLFTQNYTDDNTAWGFYTSAGLPPIIALGNTMRFEYESVSAAGGNQAIGNFIDAADFGVGVTAVPEPSSLLMGCVALGGFGISTRRRRRRPESAH